MLRTAATVALTLLSACASISPTDVLSLGDDRYFVTIQGAGGPEWDDMRKTAVTTATEHCVKMDRQVTIDDMRTRGARGWTRTAVEVKFRCAAKKS